MEACQHNQKDIIEYLVQYPTSLGIKVDGVDDAGRNALFYLSESEDTGEGNTAQGFFPNGKRIGPQVKLRNVERFKFCHTILSSLPAKMCQSRQTLLIAHSVHERILTSTFRWLTQQKWYGKPVTHETRNLANALHQGVKWHNFIRFSSQINCLLSFHRLQCCS